jgi:flagellar motility protein MotE (MotC chaperone)
MSRMIMFLSIAVILFSLAASASWYIQYRQQQETDTNAAKSGDEPPAKGLLADGAKKGSEPTPLRPLLRPTPSPETDRIAQMAATLQQQEEMLKGRETQLGVRQKQMDLIHDEVKKEQKKLDEVRKEIKGEMQLVMEKLDLLDKKVLEFERDRQKVEADKAELRQAQFETNGTEAKNLKQLAEIYDKMDAEAAAPIIVQMVESSKLDMAVTILAGMGKRQAATLLGEISRQDPTIAVQLFDRMRQRKLPSLDTK